MSPVMNFPIYHLKAFEYVSSHPLYFGDYNSRNSLFLESYGESKEVLTLKGDLYSKALKSSLKVGSKSFT